MGKVEETGAQETGPQPRSKNERRGNTGKLISSYYLEIEYLLDRVEQSSNYYQALALERSASQEEIIHAYQETIKVLHPPYYKVRAAISDEILERIDQTFARVSQAFFVLTDHSRKIEYDRSLSRPASTPLTDAAAPSLVVPAGPAIEAPASRPQTNATQDAISVHNWVSGQAAYSKAASNAVVVNRRRCERFKMAFPILIVGHDRETGKWQEVGKTIDVSKMGVGLTLAHRLPPGLVMHLTMPLPTKLRSHGYSEPGHKVYAIVRRVEPARDGLRLAGLEFLGEHPPSGYLKEPWCAFRTQKWPGADRRRERRMPLSEPVTIEFLNDVMVAIRHEGAVTENVSRSGARIRIKAISPESDLLVVANRSGSFKSVAVICNRYVGKDGFERLCVHFQESKWPI